MSLDIDNLTANRAVAAAADFAADYDTDALLVLLGRQDKALASVPEEKSNPRFDPAYDKDHMGIIDDLKELGTRIAMEAAKGLQKLICGSDDPEVTKNREALMAAAGLSEAAAIGAVTSLLLTFASPVVAAAAAVVIVRLFLVPAGNEICEFWAEKLEEG